MGPSRVRLNQVMKNLWVAVLLMVIAAVSAVAEAVDEALVAKPWHETRTANFQLFSCGPYDATAQLAARLEQFRSAYSALAGGQAVACPPVVVMVFPDDASFRPFKPLHNGAPANVSGFFRSSLDENLIALALGAKHQDAMTTIYHEYAHLLFRHNHRVWPLWLNEGMADFYAGFDVAARTVQIGLPPEKYLRVLGRTPLMPLRDLFRVTQDSPEYKEPAQQRLFYAESWLLTHYLILGDNSAYKGRLAQFTPLLRQGLPPEQAFTNACATTLDAMQARLERYLAGQRFNACVLPAPALGAPAMAARPLTPAETCFRLGDLLLRSDRVEAAESFFQRVRARAPQSALAWEGLGLAAVQRDQPNEAARCFEEAMKRAAGDFRVYFQYGRALLRRTADDQENYQPLERNLAARIRAAFERSIQLAPTFGPAFQQLGFLALIQGEPLAVVEGYLKKALALEPGDEATLFVLAQAYVRGQQTVAARQTLGLLRKPYVPDSIRAQADAMSAQLDAKTPPRPR